MRVFGSIRTILLALIIAAVPASAFAGVVVSVAIAPPPLPVYTQPICPAPGFMWTPGYWSYGAAGYYWVPGVWVNPPAVGVLWTPGYWGWGRGAYVWHRGYWGSHVGFYGGVNYGHGYGGTGFVGGAWRGGHFFYNTAVVRVNTTVIRNTYRRTVIDNRMGHRASFNGPGGVNARATRQQMQASRQARFQPTAQQVSHRQVASTNRAQFYSENHGRPAIAARDTVNGRAYNQQGRIAQGVREGQLNRGEVRRDENRQARIGNSVHRDRVANGGRLTPQERQNVDRRENHASQQIHNQRQEEARGRR